MKTECQNQLKCSAHKVYFIVLCRTKCKKLNVTTAANRWKPLEIKHAIHVGNLNFNQITFIQMAHILLSRYFTITNHYTITYCTEYMIRICTISYLLSMCIYTDKAAQLKVKPLFIPFESTLQFYFTFKGDLNP